MGLVAVELLDDSLISLAVFVSRFLGGFERNLRVLLNERDRSAADRSNSVIYTT